MELFHYAGPCEKVYGVVDCSLAHTKIAPLYGCGKLVDGETRWHVEYLVEHGKPLRGATSVMFRNISAQGFTCESLALVLVHHSQNYNHTPRFPKKHLKFSVCDEWSDL